MINTTQALPEGTILNSGQHQYRIEKTLGQGGFGITYLATTTMKLGNVPIKVNVALKEHFISSFNERHGTRVVTSNPSNAQEVQDSISCFLVEAERLNRLSIDHPGLVKVNENFQVNDTAYYVMEYIGGQNLRQFVKQQPEGRLSEREALKVFRQIAEAVSYLHENHVTHLDIKPDNILLREDGTPVLIDFGLAKHYDSQGHATSTVKMAGCSDGYAPLEQYAGITRFAPEADVYALAATLLFLLTGKDPVKASDINPTIIAESLPSDVSDTTRKAIIHAMQMMAQSRSQSVAKLLEELMACQSQPVVEEREMEGTPTKVAKKPYVEKSAYKIDTDDDDSYKAKPRRINWIVISSLIGVCLLVAVLLFVGHGESSENDDKNLTAEEMFQMGLDYFYGSNGKLQDYAEAVKCFRQAAEQGDFRASNYLGYCFENGYGVSQDYSEAVEWYRKGAEQGDMEAQHNMAVCYANGLGVSQDYVEAVKWYRKAAEQGDAISQFYLGTFFDSGRGVAQDYAEAVKWYRKSAEQGNAAAQYKMGYCYHFGGLGVTQDYAEAVKWYRKSAEQGQVNAQCNLGYCYENGEGVTQDYAEAVKWYTKAADQGDAYSQNYLGACYYEGRGVTQDKEKARELWRKSAAQGNQTAKDNLKEFFN